MTPSIPQAKAAILSILCLITLSVTGPSASAAVATGLDIGLPRGASIERGRLLLFVVPAGVSPEREPRELASADEHAIPVFGLEVTSWRPGTTRRIEGSIPGFPLRTLSALPPGRYRLQALLRRYESVRLADGRALQLPRPQTTHAGVFAAVGDRYSRPVTLEWDGTRWGMTGTPLPTVLLTEAISAPAPFVETPWVKHIQIRSERLSAFWGRDVMLGAFVTLPLGFESHPNARYPLVIQHGLFPAGPSGWRERAPDSDLAPDFSNRFQLAGDNRLQQRLAWELHQAWIAPGFPRVLLVEIQHPTPFHESSYAVNSANNGPYGDAIQYELIPEIERRFRGIGQGWARFVFGGSAGGWMAMAAQVFYPEEYNGAWIACPDPIDFRHLVSIDLHTDRNAYLWPNPFKATRRPGYRNARGHVLATIEDQANFESALALHGRSGEQWDAWESVFSPAGTDGYPRRLWDRLTGEIDPVTASHWREHYDLGHRLRRDWRVLGPKLRGKLRIAVGEADNYHLEAAVQSVERFLRTAEPASEAIIDYGPRAEHCWNGDPTRPNAESRWRYPQMVLPWAVERMLRTAPAGADLHSWRY